MAHPAIPLDQIAAAIRCMVKELPIGLPLPHRLRACTVDTHCGQAQHEQRLAQACPASHLAQLTMPTPDAVSICPPADLAQAAEASHHLALVQAQYLPSDS
jgi:hypothetical protein